MQLPLAQVLECPNPVFQNPVFHLSPFWDFPVFPEHALLGWLLGYFFFPPFPREEGRGVRGERGISLKSEEKGGGEGRSTKRVRIIFWGEGSLIFISRVEEPP